MNCVAVLRNSAGLTALLSRRRAGAGEGDWPSDGEAPDFFEIEERPLADVPPALCPGGPTLRAAWDALGAVRSADAVTLSHVLLLLRETTLRADDRADAPPPALPASPLPIPPTAAHPRAFRGTKWQPPRPPAPSAVDLRPSLCDAGALAALLGRLAPFGPDAARAAGQRAAEEQRLPPVFRSHLLPLLRPQGRGEVGAGLALYWRLSLEAQPALLAAAVRLFCLLPDSRARRWLELAAELPPEHRLLFVTLLLEVGAHLQDAGTLPEEHRRLFLLTATGPCPAWRLHGLFSALKHGVSLDYLAAGFRMDDAREGDYKFHEMDWSSIVREAYYPEAAVAKADPHWAEAKDYYPSLPHHVWMQCRWLAGLGRVIETIDWMQYSPEVSYQYSRFYRNFADYDAFPEGAEATWAVIEPCVPQINALLSETPSEYQHKLVANLKDFCWNCQDQPQTLRECLPHVETLLRRLCRPPFRTRCDVQSVGTDFLEFLDAEQRAQFLGAPDGPFLRLEDACRRDNDVRLTGRGTWSVARARPGFLLESFLTHPAKLFKVCKRLGSFSHALRGQLVREFAQSALLQDGPACVPAPRLLAEHRDGTRRLPDDQLAHYEAKWRQQIVLKQLEALEQAALTRMGEGFDADPASDAVRHALQIQFEADENRPALRRFLKAHWAGRGDYLLSHPRTQAWLKKHAGLDIALWQQGVPYAAESASSGPLTIVVERDPLEALKLGTYVGSCLGLGGHFSYSAAAAVLDINKQVLYARRPDGAVLARQLVALSEESQLVCFTVYPAAISSEVRRHFAAYDRLFAQALGLTLYAGVSDEDYTVSTIVAHDWWDDFFWPGKKPKIRASSTPG